MPKIMTETSAGYLERSQWEPISCRLSLPCEISSYSRTCPESGRCWPVTASIQCIAIITQSIMPLTISEVQTSRETGLNLRWIAYLVNFVATCGNYKNALLISPQLWGRLALTPVPLTYQLFHRNACPLLNLTQAGHGWDYLHRSINIIAWC